MSLRCLAVLGVRNEAAHLRRTIGDFVAQGINVAVVDHGSTDASPKIYADFLGAGLVSVSHLPWEGVFDQTAQLRAKENVARRLDYDWVIHADADEWLHTRRYGESLLEGIERVAELGANAVNFEEFVFLPDPRSAAAPEDCRRELLRYYFFAPSSNRLMRAWSLRHPFTNVGSGGHLLQGPGLDVAPEPFVLRHYIALSQAHVIEKYAKRVFSRGDVEKGWHQNRVGLAAERLRLPRPELLKRLPRWDRVDLDRSDPKATHFWDWRPTPGAALCAPQASSRTTA